MVGGPPNKRVRFRGVEEEMKESLARHAGLRVSGADFWVLGSLFRVQVSRIWVWVIDVWGVGLRI